MSNEARDWKLEILKRIGDLSAEDRTTTAIALVDAALALLAQQYPASLSDDDRRKVKENYKGATDELVAERAMSEEGVVIAMGAGLQMAVIAMDYSPLSHAKSEMDEDFKLSKEVMTPLVAACDDIFAKAQKAGLSHFGCAAMMIHLAAHRSVELGVPRMKLARPLMDAVGKLFDTGPAMSEEELDEHLIATIREKMSVSREVAKRYVKLAKAQRGQKL